MIIERTVRQDAIRGAILGALAFLGVVLVLALVVFWFLRPTPRYRGAPMTLANMSENRVRSLFRRLDHRLGSISSALMAKSTAAATKAAATSLSLMAAAIRRQIAAWWRKYSALSISESPRNSASTLEFPSGSRLRGVKGK
jgi:hypothetical protein